MCSVCVLTPDTTLSSQLLYESISPGVVFELEEVVEAVDAVMGSGTLTAALVAFRVTGT